MPQYNIINLCNIQYSITHLHIYDRLCINYPFTAKCKFWLRPKITAKSAQDRYSVMAFGVIYGVLAYLAPQYDAPNAYSFSRSDGAASVYG